MKNIYFNILKQIDKHGFNSYIVGGFVRDKLIGRKTLDIDICTSATPKELMSIFKDNIIVKEEYGAVKLKLTDNIFVDITTFRKDSEYKNNKPTKVIYTKSLKTDLLRRDFTINTLCLDKNGNLIDLLNGCKDIKNKLIKCIGDTKTKFNEDATRILRAIRFMTTLDFKLDDEILEYIVNNKSRICDISYAKRKEELDKIFISNNVKKFIDFIKDYELEDYLGIHCNRFVETGTVIGVWAQLRVDKNYPLTNLEKTQINKIKKIIEKGNIDKNDIYKEGLYITTIASDILGIDKRKINKLYTNLPIKGIIDINISSLEICEILNIKPSKQLGEIYKALEKEILNDNLSNEKEEIIKYINEVYNERTNS